MGTSRHHNGHLIDVTIYLIFREPTRLESTMLTILTNFLSLIDCDQCQISLSDPDRPSVFRRIFDLRRSEVGMDLEAPFENRLPINSKYTAHVAITGKINSAYFRARVIFFKDT